MAEGKNRKISVKLPFFSNLVLKLVGFLNRFLVFLQLREKREYWGVIYDSLTKQPLDPVKVSLIYADSGKVEAGCITDLAGRYGFLARPGKFKIFAQRSNYTFPSQRVKGDKDGIYGYLYHGEFFELTGDAQVIAPNIPMDPGGDDWNQQAKKRLVWERFYAQGLLEKLIAVFLWFGFVYVSVILVLNKFQPAAYRAIFFAYFAIFFLELFTPRLRLWGAALDKKSGQPIMGVRLELTHPKLELSSVSFGQATSREDGRFFLRANPGRYWLRLSDSQTGENLGAAPVKIGPEGVFNQKLLIDGFF